MSAKFFLSASIVILSVIPNACLVEQAVASVAEVLPHRPLETSHHNEKQTAPSHSHDEEGHEANFCCDNETYRYIHSQQRIDFHKVDQPNALPNLILDDTQVKDYFQFRIYLHRLKQPTSIRIRDKYALTSLLHAPPYR
jgi:hypothetical protein